MDPQQFTINFSTSKNMHYFHMNIWVQMYYHVMTFVYHTAGLSVYQSFHKMIIVSTVKIQLSWKFINSMTDESQSIFWGFTVPEVFAEL